MYRWPVKGFAAVVAAAATLLAASATAHAVGSRIVTPVVLPNSGQIAHLHHVAHGRDLFCSGVMLNQNWVLTLTSCVTGDPDVQVQYIAPTGMVSIGSETRTVVRQVSRDKIALLKVSSPVATAGTQTVATTDPPVGSTNYLYGYRPSPSCTGCSLVSDATRVSVLSTTVHDYPFGEDLHSQLLSGPIRTTDIGGVQVYNGALVGVYAGIQSDPDFTALPGSLAGVKLAPRRAWIQGVIQPSVIIDPTCPSFICP